MAKFLTDRWNDIVGLNGTQWLILIGLSAMVGTGLFYLFNWLYSQRFQAQRELIEIQTRRLQINAEIHEGIDDHTQQLKNWEGGQQGANSISADLAKLYDAWLSVTYTRLHDLVPAERRKRLETQHSGWLERRTSEAREAAVSERGSLAPLQYNVEFIETTKKRIAELEIELKASEKPRSAASRSQPTRRRSAANSGVVS
jgi:uncharacterized protein YecT (DUF1311 family)